jgi:glycosyltransferase involved in cell wall biosynthesis
MSNAGSSADTGREVGPRVLIVADGVSTRFGGEAILPWHYFRLLRDRGINARLIAHSRTRDELLSLRAQDADRIHFLPDTRFNIFAARVGSRLPAKLNEITLGTASNLTTMAAAKSLARRLIAEYGIEVVHQPIPVSPRAPSLLYGLGVPVVMGPMNGNMSYPPAFRQGKIRGLSAVVGLARHGAGVVHRLWPGKLAADTLLVANERTGAALPRGARGEVATLVENGVDLSIWSPAEAGRGRSGPARFVFVGRLIDWKRVDLLLEAFARVRVAEPPLLEIYGDGGMRSALEEQTARLGLGSRVKFGGWLPQDACAERLRTADALVLPSVFECGGAVVLEAMACGLAVIATGWGGPADYIDPSCGLLVMPDSPEAMIRGFADAMTRLATDRETAVRLGRAGREKAVREFDWEAKVDRILEVYRSAIARRVG